MRKCIYFFCCLALLFLWHKPVYAQVRRMIDFNNDWKFYKGEDSNASKPDYDDSKWRKISLPHDWSIESDFSNEYPATNQGGALPGGIGWYRKTFTVPAVFKDREVRIEFDGIYRNSTIWINGYLLHKETNGYTSIFRWLTPWIHFGKPNIIVVRVDNSRQPDSRWYTGSGIYRDARL